MSYSIIQVGVPLFGGHTADVIVEGECRREERRSRLLRRQGRRRGRPAVHGHVKTPRILLIRIDLQVLRKRLSFQRNDDPLMLSLLSKTNHPNGVLLF